MRVVSPLLSGFADAANGTAELYARGTAEPAQWFSGFYRNGGSQSQATLTPAGRAVVYVDQIVDVIVKDEDGQIVCSFTFGEDERSPSFTGIDYSTALSAANNPTTLQRILDLWKTTNGSVDWKVLLDGSAVSIQSALGALTKFIFNAKAYGAAGDGVANDYAAIVAAVAAANTAGGGVVYFPPGTYDYQQELQVPETVSLMGWSRDTTTLRMSKSGNTDSALHFPGLEPAAGIGKAQFLRGLTVTYGIANTERLIEFGNVDLTVEDFAFGDGDKVLTDLMRASNDADAFRVRVSRGETLSVADAAFRGNIAGGKWTIEDVEMSAVAAYPSSDILCNLGPANVDNCEFDFSLVEGSGSNSALVMFFGGSVTGCSFPDLKTGETNVLLCVSAPTSGDLYVTESGNRFGEVDLDPTRMKPYLNPEVSLLYPGSHETRYVEIASNEATVDLQPGYFGHIKLEPTSNIGTQTIETTSGTLPPEGVGFTLELSTLESGGAIDWTFSSDFILTAGAHASLADNKQRLLFFRHCDVGGTRKLVQVGTPVDLP